MNFTDEEIPPLITPSTRAENTTSLQLYLPIGVPDPMLYDLDAGQNNYGQNTTSEIVNSFNNSSVNCSDYSHLRTRSNIPSPASSTHSTLNRKQTHEYSKQSAALQTYLWNCIAGRVILLSYQNLDKLLSHHRENLVHIVINFKLEEQLQDSTELNNFCISTNEFIELAEAIVEIFPGEFKEVYFTPFEVLNVNNKALGVKVSEAFGDKNEERNETVDGGGKKTKKLRKPASGKLLDHYRYRKSILIQSGIVKSGKTVKNSADLFLEPISDNIDGEESITTAHKWLLEKNLEPEEKVLDCWVKTWRIRRKTLKESNLTAFDYFARYLCLNQQIGIKLIESDFTALYPEKNADAKIRWEKLRVKLLKHFREGKKFGCPKNIIELPIDQQDAFIVTLLPKLIKPAPIKRKLKEPNTTWKPSSEEIANSFIVILSNAGDINSCITKKIDEYKRRKLTLQPFLIFVKTESEEDCPFEAYYVVFDTFKYQLNSAIEAVTFAFRLFFAVDIAYPLFCRQIWQFIQKTIFDITEEGESLTIQLQLLLSNFKIE